MIKTKPPKAAKGKTKPTANQVEAFMAIVGKTADTHCPTCGKRFVAQTPAEKQRAYRERLKAASK